MSEMKSSVLLKTPERHLPPTHCKQWRRRKKAFSNYLFPSENRKSKLIFFLYRLSLLFVSFSQKVFTFEMLFCNLYYDYWLLFLLLLVLHRFMASFKWKKTTEKLKSQVISPQAFPHFPRIFPRVFSSIFRGRQNFSTRQISCSFYGWSTFQLSLINIYAAYYSNIMHNKMICIIRICMLFAFTERRKKKLLKSFEDWRLSTGKMNA